MAYRGGSLVDLFSRETTAAPTRRAMRSIAGSVGDAMTHRAASYTPVGETGNLKRRWRSLTVEEDREGRITSGTTNPSPVAHLVEYGTRPHRIEPDDAGALDPPGGADHPVTGVDHPGSEGAFMLTRAVAEIETELSAIAQPHLTTWAGEIEAAAKRHKGIA